MLFKQIIIPVIIIGIDVVYVLAEESELRVVIADRGSNVSLPCGVQQDPKLRNPPLILSVQWVHGGNGHHEILRDGSLFLNRVEPSDAGVYMCTIENETAFAARINLTVKTEPPALANVTVHASTILALILWNVAGDGGHPIIDFTAQYRSATPVNGSLEPWRPISPNHISPNSRQIDVYHLKPNASYWFRAWASNVLGPGPVVEVLATTLYSDQDAELYRHFLVAAESFDPRTWVAAVCVVLGTLILLAAGTTVVLCREWRRPDYGEDLDVIELVPNIILNPGFVENEPIRFREYQNPSASIIRSSECPGPGKPRKV